MKLVTIFGASGFVGSHLAAKLRELNVECFCPARDEVIGDRWLGEVVYCIGLTADFRTRPYDTVEAHVTKLAQVLKETKFDSLLYLSSARIYKSGSQTNEDAPIEIDPSSADDLYNISKAMGESLAFASGPKTRVVRISNVYGRDSSSVNFLSSIILDAVRKGRIQLRTSLDSEKDYVSVDQVVELLIEIMRRGQHRLYNIASGKNVSNGLLIERIQTLTGCQVEVEADAARIAFPPIDVGRIKSEFGFRPRSVLDDIEQLVSMCRATLGDNT